MAAKKDREAPSETTKEKILRLANKRLARCVDADQHNRSAAIEDLKFLNGEQWDENELKLRKVRKRPALQINLLPKYVDQIVGEERLNRPRVKIRPVDSKADVHLARIREGIVRNIEYLSRADQIYDQAFEMAASCGYGAWRPLTRYTEENPFIQEIYLESVKNPFLVFLDPDCKDDTFADAKFGFVLQRMPKEDFDEKWPNAQYPGDSLKIGIGMSNELWFDQNTVTVAEYFVKETEKKKMAQLSDGTVLPYEEASELVAKWEAKAKEITAAIQAAQAAAALSQPSAAAVPGSPIPPGPASSTATPPGEQGASLPGAVPGASSVPAPSQVAVAPVPPAESIIAMTLGEKPRIAKSKDTEIVKIRRYIINGADVIEGLDGDEKYFPGKYIPIILVLGKERNIEGKRYVRGMIRDAKDAQRLVNYWECLSTDTPLPTPNGWTTMAAIRAGDKLFDEKGSVCTVTGISTVHYDRECYKVTFNDGSSVTTDANHLWKVEERIWPWPYTTATWREKIIRTFELNPKRHFINITKPLNLPEIKLLLSPYVLGAWLGDGNNKDGRISCSDADSELIEHIEAEGIAAHAHKMTVGRSCRAYRLGDWVAWDQTGSITTTLRELGVLQNKHIPQEYLRSSKEQRIALLQGLMDNDGSIHRKLFQCSFSTVYDRLAMDFHELLRSLGIKATFIVRDRKDDDGNPHNNGKMIYQFSFTCPKDIPVFRLKRKLAIQQSKINFHARRTGRHGIINVEKVPSVPVKCVMVSSESNLFLAGEAMVPTHNTSTAETVALAPKAPWLVTPRMVDGFENDYATAHIENFPYLKYNIDPNSPTSTPTRTHPGDPPLAMFAQRQSAHDNLKQVIGMFKSDVGDEGPERSAPAIIARQTPGDVGTFAFLDNLSRAIAHSGRIINEMIPEVYDTERDVRLRNIDETETFVPVNTTAGNALKAIRQNPKRYEGLSPDKLVASMRSSGPDARFNDITVGKYDVVVSVGPSYTTQRQEASQNLFTLINSMPDKMGIAADILVENMDFPGADRLAARLRKALPPALVEQKPGEPPPEPQPPPLQVQVQMKKLELENKKIDVQLERQKVEQIKALKEAADAQGNVKAMIMGLLKELMAADHPADVALRGAPRNPMMNQ